MSEERAPYSVVTTQPSDPAKEAEGIQRRLAESIRLIEWQVNYRLVDTTVPFGQFEITAKAIVNGHKVEFTRAIDANEYYAKISHENYWRYLVAQLTNDFAGQLAQMG